MLEIIRVESAAQKRAFMNLPYEIYRGSPTWTPPLRIMEADRFNPKKNPGLENLDVAYWLAYARGKPVGRCASFVNQAHLDIHNDQTGHFGFLDTCLGHPAAIEALLNNASQWLQEKGMTHMAGPFNFSVNEECGMLIDGFDTKQMMLMPHGRPDYPLAMEAFGFEKAMDTFAYISELHEGYPRPPLMPKMQKMVEESTSIQLRPMRKERFEQEVALAMDIFNDAWSDNWGFVPYSDAQVKHMANELKILIDPEGFWFGEVDGVAKGFVILAPNLNEALEGLDGRLFPIGWAKLLYRLKIKRLRSGRIPLMGIRKNVQKTRTGVALMMSLFEAAYAACRPKEMQRAELSWILETNKDVQNMIAMCGAEIWKTYRIYKMAL
ncbi:MAG: hypothetical protein AAF950_15705 [Pseudomonadota bacterium]